MNAGYGRKAFQLVHGELQRAVYHAVDHEFMLFRIEVRNNCAAMSTNKMERGWRDIPHLLLQRGQYVKDQPELIGRRPVNHGYAYGGDETGALAIGNEVLETFLRLGLRQCCLSTRSFHCTNGGRRGAGFQESSSTRFFRHDFSFAAFAALYRIRPVLKCPISVFFLSPCGQHLRAMYASLPDQIKRSLPGLPRGWSYAETPVSAFHARSLCLNDLHGFIELEGKHRLRRHSNGGALGQNLSQSPASGASPGSDCCAFSAARDRADNRAEGSGAACIFGRSLIRAKSLLAALSQVGGADQVLLALNGNRL